MQPRGAASQPDVVVSSISQYTLHAKRIGAERQIAHAVVVSFRSLELAI
jgi:hypothetical protein